MKKLILFVLLISISSKSFCQSLTAQELLNKSIAYHDPNNAWHTFKGTLEVTMEIPNKSNRDSKINIDLAHEYFNLITKRDSAIVTYTHKKGECIISKNDSIRISMQKEKPKRSHCEMTELYKNYYTYLYGLPMKLKDPGTIISEEVKHKTFKGKDYLVIDVNYDAQVGSDAWSFYFDPITYAMEIYQFFRTDEKGKTKPDTGEYILLSEEAIINSIKMPKIRAWYYNKDDKYLGTDILKI
ncbi:DUF6503 family protein [Algibacter mikhailovii]|uniref:GLPGLI family protein n=1 Tax=Algibacter mikhailovii TaxID=425498 RepID=A0A918VAX7_9FLAO|nr:DUF6503 family protein [Algibacter mikhailovii]GGZ84397.1 hypothetical protein GCM10007028_22900 [Algibacter mikhailovii]